MSTLWRKLYYDIYERANERKFNMAAWRPSCFLINMNFTLLWSAKYQGDSMCEVWELWPLESRKRCGYNILLKDGWCGGRTCAGRNVMTQAHLQSGRWACVRSIRPKKPTVWIISLLSAKDSRIVEIDINLFILNTSIDTQDYTTGAPPQQTGDVYSYMTHFRSLVLERRWSF